MAPSPHYTKTIVGRDSSVGIGTPYGLDGLGIESHWGVRFSASVQSGRGSHPASYTIGTESFLGVKMPGRGVNNQPHLAPKLKKEEYLFSPSVPSWQVLGQDWQPFFKGACPNCPYVPLGNLKRKIRAVINYCIIIINNASYIINVLHNFYISNKDLIKECVTE
jgi:hypothetical protein